MDTSTTSIDAIAAHWLVGLATLAVIIVVTAIMLTMRVALNRRYLRHRNLVWLEITPPSSINKTPEATEQLFTVIHGSRAARPLKDRLLGRSPVLSFEIVSTRKEGIRYLIQLENKQSASLEQIIAAYIPDAKVREVEYSVTEPDAVIEFEEKGHYVLPLTLTSTFEQHDPLSYITSAMTKLSDGESITLQIVATPIRLREAEILSLKILDNENILQEVSNHRHCGLHKLANGLGKLSSGMTDLASEIFVGTTSSYSDYYRQQKHTATQQSEIRRNDRPSRSLSSFEQELMDSMHRKVTQPLFQVSLHLLVKSPEAPRHITSLKSALDGFSVPPYQSLKAKSSLPVITNLRHRAGINRLPTVMRRSSIILSVSEMASLYHFPPSYISKTDNLVTSLSKTLPAPLSLKQDTALDVVIGVNRHRNVETLIGLTTAERERHVYIIGGTGNGKTTMLQYQIVQDMKSDKGLAIVDPHGDLAETILEYVPKERIKDVIYFNPDDIARPIALNLLELPEGLSEDEELHEKDLVTEALISVFRKIFSDEDTGGHRIEYVLRNAIQTALTVPDSTLFTIFHLLNDPSYRSKVVARLDNKDLINFWKHELGKAGDMQKVKMSAGITSKIGRFLFSASAKRILEQPKSSINFEDIIDQKKILICNFSKGLIGEDTSELFGITVLAKLQLASLRRARIKQSQRVPFYLYVDEFQNFATQSFVQMLSESRKYKLFLTMAEQSTSQQKDQQMVQIILANVGTVICFRTGNPADEKLLLPLFKPYITEGEISNQPPFNFYARFASTKSQEPLSGETLMLQSDGNGSIAKKVKNYSRSTYGREPLPKESVSKSQTSKKDREGKTTGSTAKTTNSSKNPEDDRE